MQALEEPEPTEEELRAVVGRNADYYVAQWRGTAKRTVNWSAVLLSGVWLPFRRLYRIAAIFYAVLIGETVVEQVVAGWLGAEVPHAVERAAGIAAAIVCGTFGNVWYLAHVRRVVAKARAEQLPQAEHLRVLASRGGTRPWAAIAGFVSFATGMIVVTGVLALFGYE